MLRCRRSASPSAPPGIAGPLFRKPSTKGMSWRSVRRSATIASAAGHRRPAVPWHRHPRSVRAGVASALEVLAANGVDVMLADGDEYTPTPAISHAILTYNRGRTTDWPTASSSHPRTIRPTTAASSTTRPTAGRRIPTSPAGLRAKANEFLAGRPAGSAASSLSKKALRAATTHRHDYLGAYVGDLGNVRRHGAIRGAEDQPRGRSAGRCRRSLLGARSPSAKA